MTFSDIAIGSQFRDDATQDLWQKADEKTAYAVDPTACLDAGDRASFKATELVHAA